ncbi:cytochrome c oxidase subunit II [Deinococcus hopiensis]|uniref:Cytochrome c oxidase subunit 2 n=1 Tax=Deinococcus hopiensis KR-140 TaxID=695939 RepID=A0A1W1VAU0_9DEIO|nr:cytochrome c oxidase subunit 2 [Deinococcus hopiensis KR-140]
MNTNHSRRRSGPPRSRTRRAALAGLLGLAATLMSGCSSSERFLFLGDMSSQSNKEVFWMSIPAIALSIIIFFGVSFALFYTVQRFREDKHDAPPAQFHGNNRLETLLVAVPVLIVLLLSVLTVRTLARINPTPRDAVRVDVLGKQFWWNFAYPDAAAAAGGNVSNGNELIIPVGRQIALTMTGGDVIHGFWAPNLGGQRFATPGSQKTWQVDTERPGVYQGNCSVLCGASHANMRFKVVALPQDRYTTFVKAAQAYRAPTPAGGSAEARGYTLFMQGKPGVAGQADSAVLACASCHRVQGTPANGAAGPDLSFFGTRHTLGAGMWEGEQAREMLIPWIKNPMAVKPGALMPPYDGSTYVEKGKTLKASRLSDAEIGDIAAYLRSLRLPEEADYWRDVPVIGAEGTPGGQGNQATPNGGQGGTNP